MDSVLDQIGEWLKELLVSGIMNQLTGLFDSVNTQVGDIATQVGTTPANFSRVNPKFCVNSNSGANRAKFICGGSRLVRLPPY